MKTFAYCLFGALCSGLPTTAQAVITAFTVANVTVSQPLHTDWRPLQITEQYSDTGDWFTTSAYRQPTIGYHRIIITTESGEIIVSNPFAVNGAYTTVSLSLNTN